MSGIIFLRKPAPLASQVAEILYQDGGYDLTRVEVWIPTAGAGRRIRRALAERGVLSPLFKQPMRALLPDGVRIAERFEREGAWALALKKLDHNFLRPLFSDARLDTYASRLKSAGVLCELCDLLAEAELSPSSECLEAVCGEDAERWVVLGRVYQCYLAILRDFDLADPNEARFAEIKKPTRADTLERLVIACIPDLPLIAQRFAEALEKLGVKVEVLVWLPGVLSGGFDAWGRPVSEQWAECHLELESSQIIVARSPEDEARQAMDFAVSSLKNGDYAVVLANPDLGSFFCSEVESRGGKAFLPDGGRLDLTEAGIIALEWVRFQSLGDLRVLRRLLELPRFSRVLRSDSEFKVGDALAICDYLIGDAILSDLSQAVAFAEMDFNPEKEKSRCRVQLRDFVELVKLLLPLTVPSLLAKAWRTGGEGLEAAQKVECLYKAIHSSPLYFDSGDMMKNAFARALKSAPLFDASNPGDVELSGWLETPWLEAGRLALCGCVEGFLPASVNGHPFLPDSKRNRLGLANNSARFARDAYLFQCLLIQRPAEEFCGFFSRFDADGSPTLPSRLFLRCGEDWLPRRALKLFGELAGLGSRAQRRNNWKWSLPAAMRKQVVKISPTDFSDYLACPFRFYLKRVLWLDAFTSDAREMDAINFGILVHEALEKFGRETPEESNPVVIERLVLEHLDSAAARLFGPSPSPAVRIQLEAAKLRLRAFSTVQAAQIAAGWRIVSTERKLEADAGTPLLIGALGLSGKIDRIEKNDQTGAWRVLDYKTHAKAISPAKKHFGPRLSSEWLPQAEVDYASDRGTQSKRWADLQLPLYSKILRHWHGDEIGDAPVCAAYFTLSADPGETAVHEFTELDNAVLDSAMACANAIAALVHKGVFWPPQSWKSTWDDPFGAVLLNGKPADCLESESIAFLEGRK